MNADMQEDSPDTYALAAPFPVEAAAAAVNELAERGLQVASKWLAELLLSLDSDSQPIAIPPSAQKSVRVSLAQRYLACREYKECARLLEHEQGPLAKWLWLYSRYLDAYASDTAASPAERGPRTAFVESGDSTPVSSELLSILAELKGADAQEDPFLLYLRALVLSKLGQRAAAMTTLVESVHLYAFNWSAWLKLTELLDGDEELLALFPHLPQGFMTAFFKINATLEVHRASENMREYIAQLAEKFPGSVHLRSQRALLEYHMRDFDLAEQLFDQIAEDYPNRLEDIDTYSNILYVMGKRAKLSHIAHKYSKIDGNRPETCCLIGNLFSLRGEHSKAIAYFRRALKLDPKYLAAWTLMGHEYVELSNTHAAIEAYRRACSANSKDYRAWYGLGQAYELLNMHVYALRYFQKATALRPYDSRMWHALGNCYSRLAKPHEVLKCYKRAQHFAESDDISILRKLGDHCLSMHLFTEAALYWETLVQVAETTGLNEADYLSVYNLLAAYEMGEHHLAAKKRRRRGDLLRADAYLSKVLASNSEDVEYAKRLQKTLRELQLS